MMEGGRTPWTILTYAYAFRVAGVLGYVLMGIPIQVSDCFGDMVALSSSFSELVGAALSQGSTTKYGNALSSCCGIV
jgi:hypothetical protein